MSLAVFVGVQSVTGKSSYCGFLLQFFVQFFPQVYLNLFHPVCPSCSYLSWECRFCVISLSAICSVVCIYHFVFMKLCYSIFLNCSCQITRAILDYLPAMFTKKLHERWYLCNHVQNWNFDLMYFWDSDF